MSKKYTTAQAAEKLGMHISTFNKRARTMRMHPINSDPMLIRPRFSVWSEEQVEQIGAYAQRQLSFRVSA